MSLSYQHCYHAGNFADIHKHLWLIATLRDLHKNHQSIFWIDTHAGRGLYDLNAPESLKTQEASFGILKGFETSLSWFDSHIHQTYKNIIHAFNPQGGVSHYPGSPLIAAHLLRKNDRIACCELHPQEFIHLRRVLGTYPNVAIRHKDITKELLHLMPPPGTAGGMLVDPSYEIKAEYDTIPLLLIRAHHKWPQGVFILWYPILSAGRHNRIIDIISGQLPPHYYTIDECQAPYIPGGRMLGSGIIRIEKRPI
ncbi:MAG: 23S rRNA (adenine(2030)-N(6))-methyltransferase RlmJ [Alphaproteobacteria bacterium]|nr:MAG: 23S rRNA (adenine(2030)-N(6))-methyltransferase RlmJ [Alphaproteobacteria bacterium]